MARFPPPQIPLLLITILLSSSSGCDETVTEVAREAADRQAEQNRVMAELQQQVAAGSHQLVEADARARQEIIGVHRDLQAERKRLDTSWDVLQRERRTESWLAPTLSACGAVLIVSLVLVFCWYAIFATHRDDNLVSDLQHLLLQELSGQEPWLISSVGERPALPDQSHSDETLVD